MNGSSHFNMQNVSQELWIIAATRGNVWRTAAPGRKVYRANKCHDSVNIDHILFIAQPVCVFQAPTLNNAHGDFLKPAFSSVFRSYRHTYLHTYMQTSYEELLGTFKLLRSTSCYVVTNGAPRRFQYSLCHDVRGLRGRHSPSRSSFRCPST